MSGSKCIYTCLVGEYENLSVAPKFEGVTTFCITDRDVTDSKGWNIIQESQVVNGDSIRSQRYHKTMAHPKILDFDYSVYIDNSVELLKNPFDYWHDYMSNYDLVMISHSFRPSLIKEFEAVVKQDLDDANIVLDSLLLYAGHFRLLKERPLWGGLIVRNNRTRGSEIMGKIWFDLICKNSRRDQLTLPLAIAKSNVRIYIENNIDLMRNDVFCWPRRSLRRNAISRLWKNSRFKRKYCLAKIRLVYLFWSLRRLRDLLA
jgi:hypothetical protein